MDVSNLKPSPATSKAAGAASPAAPRGRADRAGFPVDVAVTAAEAAVARPAPEAGDHSDRIERSEELTHAVLEQTEGLARLAPPTQERIDEYRAGLAAADSASRTALETAASGLLSGELFFARTALGS
jgi:hypothetical protein